MSRYCPGFLQDDMYRPDYYMPLLEFRDLTLKRLQHFADQRFFSVRQTTSECFFDVAD